MLLSIIKEYGISWTISRTLYSVKLRSMNRFPFTEKLYERKIPEVLKIDLFNINIEKLRAFLHELPDEDKNSIITRADRATEGKLLSFSNIELNYGRPLNWQLNPITGNVCDKTEKWFGIPDFDKERGDIKLVWEASRFSHFLLFVRAYLLSNDKRYFDSFKDQLVDWISSNSYSYGANYKCSQECSIRLANAMITYSAFKSLGLQDSIIDKSIKELVSNTYHKILSNFFYAYKCIKNDHTFSELMGIIICSWCCEDKKRLKWANRILNEVICDQFTVDGGYKSFSFNYEREIFQDIECVLSVRDRLGLELTTESQNRLIRAILLLYNLQTEKGSLPNYGSNDGALVFQVASCQFSDFRPTLNSLYSLLTGKQLYSLDKHVEEMIWFGKYDAAMDEINKKSACYPEAGLFVIYGESSKTIIVLNDYKTRPAHMDQLHVDMWVGEINLFCDTGTYSYVEDEGKKLIMNDFHNTVKVNGLVQMSTLREFMIYNWTKREGYIFDKTSFSGKMKSINGYTHNRQVKYIEKEYIITDTIHGESGKEFKIFFHTPCEVEKLANKIELSYGGKIIAEVTCSNAIEMGKSRRSLSYLHMEEINCIYISGVLNYDTTVITQIRMLGGE